MLSVLGAWSWVLMATELGTFLSYPRPMKITPLQKAVSCLGYRDQGLERMGLGVWTELWGKRWWEGVLGKSELDLWHAAR